ncbi:uroporphyrinogen III synthase [Salinisphaera orenii MK-B5]|uniref:Uroporphyrinogen III synthase n=1 Tax=Salinisphaera orenii MK-B5 TaxID=856730 RepID=A0A423PVB6_9GAMM|nr:uroporphyrinogen-III synthase [Salinisphaera orenii]ROO29519.1 uroporphyrinogen III synthase [Salinisphaera orenii MK-B5]
MTADTAPAEDMPLSGRRIGVPESRQLDLFADMLERRGAAVRRCPLVDIRDTPDTTAVTAWLDDVIAHGLDEMIWLTGEGLRRLRSFAERAGPPYPERFAERLAATRAVTRGPKPTRELRAMGLRSDIAATEPTTAGVIDALEAVDLAGHRVGVQLYGSDPNRPLMDFLARKQADVRVVAPYVYADEAEEPQVLAFIDALVDGELDGLAFTSSPQVRRLLKVARGQGREAELIAAMNARCVAAVGPLVAERLRDAGIAVTLMPESSYFMKPLVRALVEHFAD